VFEGFGILTYVMEHASKGTNFLPLKNSFNSKEYSRVWGQQNPDQTRPDWIRDARVTVVDPIQVLLMMVLSVSLI